MDVSRHGGDRMTESVYKKILQKSIDSMNSIAMLKESMDSMAEQGIQPSSGWLYGACSVLVGVEDFTQDVMDMISLEPEEDDVVLS